MRAWLLVGAIALAACGSDDETPRVGSGAGPCSERAAGSTYLVRIVERAGTCQLGTTETVVQLNASRGAGCTGTSTDSADKCETSFDTNCPATGIPGGRITEVGKVKWAQDSAFGSGVETVSIYDAAGVVLCTATVDVTYTRQ